MSGVISRDRPHGKPAASNPLKDSLSHGGATEWAIRVASVHLLGADALTRSCEEPYTRDPPHFCVCQLSPPKTASSGGFGRRLALTLTY